MTASQIEPRLSPSTGDEGEPRLLGQVETVTVVLPCLNEADSVGLVVREALETLSEIGMIGEVLVVDNGSEDRSAEVALAAGARVIHERRRGYGRALRTGIAAATGTIVVMADADWTYDMRKLGALITPVLQGTADIAIGARLQDAARDTMPLLHRYVGTPVLTALVKNAGFSGELHDSQSGFRCFRKTTIAALNLQADGMEFASEMLIKGARRQLHVVNVPTGYRKRIGVSKLNSLADGWRHLRLILLLAPEILFLAPGVAVFVLGAVLTAVGFMPSRGIELGSLRWQPIFFASIGLVLGTQMTLVGLVFAWRRAAASGAKSIQRLGFVRSARFPMGCSILGSVLVAIGLGVDSLLFAQWVGGHSTMSAALPLASLAQSLLLVGGSLASFGLIVMWLHWDERQSRDSYSASSNGHSSGIKN